MHTKTKTWVAVVSALTAVAASAQPALGEHVTIYAAAAMKTPLAAVVAEYERATGHTVAVVLDTAGATEQRFRADPEAAVLITTSALIQRAEREAALRDGTSIPLGHTVAGVAVPPGGPKPDISSPDALKAALLAARRIAFSDPARGATVGNHFLKVIESLGVKDEVMRKATLARDGIETMRLVLEEGVDIGITQTSEILQANRDAVAGPFPKAFELTTAYSLWHRRSISPAVSALVARLTSAAGRERLAADGILPAAR